MKLSKKKIIWFVVFALVAILVWLYPIIAPCRYDYKSGNGGASTVFPGFYQKSVSFKIKEFLQEWLPPVFCVEAQDTESELMSDLKNLKNASSTITVAYDKIKIFDAWNAIIGSSLFPFQSTTTIGIIDSGVDATAQSSHPEFVGVNFGKSRPFALVDRAEDSRPDLIFGHGTAVAGIIGANNILAHQEYIFPQMNGILSGITEKYVLESRTAPLTHDFETSAFGNIIRSTEQSSIINMSLGVPVKDEDFIASTKYFSQLFKKHSDKLFIVGAGNDGEDALVSIPANVIEDNVLVVGATDINDNRAKFSVGSSNFGSTVNISAPGEKIFAPAIQDKGSFPTSGQYQYDYQKDFGGTSGAAPLVTGVAGLLKAINPSLTPAEIKQILIRTSDTITTDKPIGGRLNAYRAVCDPDVLNCALSVMWDSSESPFGFALGWDNYSFPLFVTTSGTPSSLQFFLDNVTVPVSGYFTVEVNGIMYATSSIFTTGVFDEHGVWTNAHKFTVSFTESTNIPVGTSAFIVGHFGGGQWSGLWGGFQTFIGTLYGTDMISTPTLSTPAQFQLSNMSPVTTATPMGGVISPP